MPAIDHRVKMKSDAVRLWVPSSVTKNSESRSTSIFPLTTVVPAFVCSYLSSPGIPENWLVPMNVKL